MTIVQDVPAATGCGRQARVGRSGTCDGLVSRGGGMTQLERMHHIAYVVKDQEATRQFYEDVVGLRLVATWAEVNDIFPDFPGRKVEYCHTFFALGDGSALAFFAFADDDVYETMRNRNGLAHAAIAVTPEEQERIKAQLEDAG